jgi:hypothetical protein
MTNPMALPPVDPADIANDRDFIIHVPNGKSFIDVGGPYRVVKEPISVGALDEAQSVDRTPD